MVKVERSSTVPASLKREYMKINGSYSQQDVVEQLKRTSTINVTSANWENCRIRRLSTVCRILRVNSRRENLIGIICFGCAVIATE